MFKNLVSVQWLRQRLDHDRYIVIDGTWHMPPSNKNAFLEYKLCHIKGAIFFDIDAVANKHTDLPHMLPDMAQFHAFCSAAGITTESHIIIYDSYGLFSAARIWWMFKVFGHQKVSILAGGLPVWQKAKAPIETGLPPQKNTQYKAQFQANLVSDFEAVQNALVTKSAVILDARSEGRFSGKMPEPRENLPSGHMPGALNIPFDRVIDQQAGTLKDTRQLQVIFNKYLPTERQKIITSCGSGMTACILSLALDELGYDSSVYDGSWTEWASKGESDIVTSEPR